MTQNSRFISLIAVYFVTILLISNIVSTKIVEIGPFTFDGGTILFPISYILGDIFSEVYGFKTSRRIIWMGFGAILLLGLVVIIVGVLPASPEWGFQEDYDNILGMTPRIILASLCGYFVGEFSNSYTLAKIKVWMKGKHLWVRTIGSTLIGELLDTVIFVCIAFIGLFSTPTLIAIIVSNYIFKVGIEILATPITYWGVAKLKTLEGIDVYDTDTNFNPFRLK